MWQYEIFPRCGPISQWNLARVSRSFARTLLPLPQGPMRGNAAALLDDAGWRGSLLWASSTVCQEAVRAAIRTHLLACLSCYIDEHHTDSVRAKEARRHLVALRDLWRHCPDPIHVQHVVHWFESTDVHCFGVNPYRRASREALQRRRIIRTALRITTGQPMIVPSNMHPWSGRYLNPEGWLALFTTAAQLTRHQPMIRHVQRLCERLQARIRYEPHS